MILSDLKSYLVARKRAPIGDLANHFDADPNAVRGMLDHFIRRGYVSLLDVDGDGACSGCQKCDAFSSEIYEWTGPRR